MDHKKKARRIVMRHTKHGLNKTDAKLMQAISSLGTERNYAQALTNYLRWCDQNDVQPNLYSNSKVLRQYLDERSEWIKQKTLDQERQALQLVYRQKLPYVRSQQVTILEKRSYTLAQVNLIASHQKEGNSVTTLLSLHSGLRAHESATILPLEERPPSSHRNWDSRRFLGFSEHRLYTVIGKGGLIREVAIPLWMSEKLESKRIPPKQVIDRGIFYVMNYEIGFGQAWSQSFSDASKKALGYSTGAHGLRHSFAKKRLYELIDAIELHDPKIAQDRIYEEALLILSQELGHFRLDIVYCYLR